MGAFIAKIISAAGYDSERLKEMIHKKLLKVGTVKDPESFDFGANASGEKSCS